MRFRCIHCGPPMGSPGWQDGFLFEADEMQCPKCGRAGPSAIAPVQDVHLLVPDLKGPIQGMEQRLMVACEPRRDVLARHRHDLYAATADVLAVTCRSCKGTEAYKALAAVHPELALRDRIQARLTSECCG